MPRYVESELRSKKFPGCQGKWLNVAKTKCMLLHSSRRIPTSALEVQLSGRTIDRIQRYEFLGVTITDTLSWSDHIDEVCSKASRGLSLLQRLAWFLPRSALVCYYNAYVLPHLITQISYSYRDITIAYSTMGIVQYHTVRRYMLGYTIWRCYCITPHTAALETYCTVQNSTGTV